MTVKTIVDNENGRKWEIVKSVDNLYNVNYYEFFQDTGWRLTGTDEGYAKDAVEWEYDIEVA